MKTIFEAPKMFPPVNFGDSYWRIYKIGVMFYVFISDLFPQKMKRQNLKLILLKYWFKLKDFTD